MRKSSPWEKKEICYQEEKPFEYAIHEIPKNYPKFDGDKVFGFITINDGIKVHKKNCPNSLSLQSNYDYRIIKAKWIDSSQEKFTVQINITGIDKLGLLNNITKVISENMNINMKRLNFETAGNTFVGNIIISVKSNVEVNNLIKKLKVLNGIDKIKRT